MPSYKLSTTELGPPIRVVPVSIATFGDPKSGIEVPLRLIPASGTTQYDSEPSGISMYWISPVYVLLSSVPSVKVPLKHG